MYTKANLVSDVAKRSNQKKAVVEEVLSAVKEAVIEYINDNKTTNSECKGATSIRFFDFGTLYSSFAEGRDGVNPKNAEETIKIPSTHRLYLSFSKALKEAVNAKKKKAKKEEKKAKKEEKKANKKAIKATEKKASKAVKAKVKKAVKKVVDDDDDEDDDD